VSKKQVSNAIDDYIRNLSSERDDALDDLASLLGFEEKQYHRLEPLSLKTLQWLSTLVRGTQSRAWHNGKNTSLNLKPDRSHQGYLWTQYQKDGKWHRLMEDGSLSCQMSGVEESGRISGPTDQPPKENRCEHCVQWGRSRQKPR
jgi:hypothetical protein